MLKYGGVKFFKKRFFYLTAVLGLSWGALYSQEAQKAAAFGRGEEIDASKDAELKRQAENETRIASERRARYEALRKAEKERVEILMGKLAAQTAASDKKYSEAYMQSLRTSSPQLVAESPMQYDTESGVMSAKGNARLYSKDFEIGADKIEFNSRKNTASASGDVRISQERLRAVSDRVDFDIEKSAVKTAYTRLGSAPVYLEADSLKGGSPKYEANNAKVYFGEPDWAAINADVGSISYDRDADRLELDDAVFRIGPVPVMYFPYYSQKGLDRPPFIYETRVGYNSDFGAKFQNTLLYTGLGDVSPGVLLDYYTKRGVLFGPAADFGYKNGGFSIAGNLRSGYINDNGGADILGFDELGRAIDNRRYFIDFDAKVRVGESFRLTSVLNYWSDQFVTRDFREDLFYHDQTPDNFTEAVYYGSSWQASVFARYLPNSWVAAAQRLPEARIDVSPMQIFNTGFYHNAYVSAGYYRATSPEGLFEAMQTGRFDAYYGLSRPVKLNSWSSITPIAGARITHYTSALNGGDYTRMIGQFGFDAQMEAWGLWEIRSKTLKLDGVRHRLRPIIKYRYMPAADQGNARVTPIDRLNYSTYPAILDLDLMRNTDEMYSMNTIRFGLENVFETRDGAFGSREVARLNLYQDINFEKYPYITDSSRRYDYSDFYVSASVSPARWISFSVYSRLNPNDAHISEVCGAVRISDGDSWAVSFGNVYLEPDLSQLYASIYHKFTERYAVLARWYYDVKISTMTDQIYTLRTRLGNSWFIDYNLSYRSGSARENNLSFGANIVYLMQ